VKQGDHDQVDFVAFAAFISAKRGGEPSPPRRAIRPWQWILAAHASQDAFGTPWAQTNQRCAAEIRRQLR